MTGPGHSLDGRVALITGASSGIGAHLARLFARAGAKVVLGARRVDRIAALADDIGQSALPVAMDVTDEASIVAAFDAAQARFGPPDTVQPGYILTETDAAWFATEPGQAQIASWPRRRLMPIAALDEPMLFFATDASAHVTGAHITVDDGQSL